MVYMRIIKDKCMDLTEVSFRVSLASINKPYTVGLKIKHKNIGKIK